MNVYSNPITVIENESQWKIYENRWTANFEHLGGKPLRYPCIVNSFSYSDTDKFVKHIFAYEEIVLAFKIASKKNKK